MIQLERPLLLLAALPIAAVLGALWWRACRIVAALPFSRASHRRRNLLRGALRIAAGMAAVLAASGPLLQRPGASRADVAHVIFVLDVSGSMLARDVAPDRLTAAKSAIERLCALVPGDAAGLIAAASGPTVVCPPTADGDAFQLLLDGVDAHWTTSAGTSLAPAVQEAGSLLERAGSASGAVVLVSDGEDHGPPLAPVLVAARQRGAVVHCVCVGGESPAAVQTPDLRGALHPKLDAGGLPVFSSARPDRMLRWAEAGGGRSWRVSPTFVTLPSHREQVVRGAGRVELADRLAGLDLTPHVCLLAALLALLDIGVGLRAR